MMTPLALHYITLHYSHLADTYPERRTMKCKSEPGTSELKTREESTVFAFSKLIFCGVYLVNINWAILNNVK